MIYLSKRETEVLKLLSDGFTTEEIAIKLFISNHTVEWHRKSLLQKFEAKNSNHLIKIAFIQGIITVDVSIKDILKRKPLKIMVTDDDTEDQELIKSALKEADENHEVVFAVNGEDLLFKLNELHASEDQRLPDLIFLDLNMPVKDGRDTLKEIKQSAQFSKIPVFIYTSSTSSKDVNLCYEQGANLFIKKPSDFNKINVVVKSLFDLFNEFVSLPTPKKLE